MSPSRLLHQVRACTACVDLGPRTYEHEVGVDNIEGSPPSPAALDGNGYVEERVANGDPNVPLDMRGTAYERALLTGKARTAAPLGGRPPDRRRPAMVTSASPP
ncbi:hypothetical protein RSO01_24570 [Reyranella soli]|uniref:Uncharacterized protein n=1 Tax=Reyranella soli TaxID=1230389 RepID=A0A512N9D9_9HYPH|nr:hypothetical protein RSO01_24570 [Reyranella soli]